MPSQATIDSTDFYRRQARKLRYELRDEPIKLHRSLAALSQWHNLASPKTLVWQKESRRDNVQDLVAAVVQRMEGPLLRYPARVALLKQAQRAGLAKFDANLIITAVQHRMGERIARTPRPDRPWLRTLAIAIIFQAWIFAGLYYLFAA
jgi:hypothetical protein